MFGLCFLLVLTFMIGFVLMNVPQQFKKNENFLQVEDCINSGRCQGNLIQNNKIGTYQECMKNCQNKYECSWISYNDDTKDCYLYSTCADISVKVNR